MHRGIRLFEPRALQSSDRSVLLILGEADNGLLGGIRYLRVGSKPTVEGVVAANSVRGVERVVAIPPGEVVGSSATFHRVSSANATKYVVAAHALDGVVAPKTTYLVVASQAADDVVC